MISCIFQGTLGNVVNLEFNSPFRMETKKGAHQGGCWIPTSHKNGQCVVWLGNKKSVCWPPMFELTIVRLVISNICGERGANLFPSKSFSLFFHFWRLI